MVVEARGFLERNLLHQDYVHFQSWQGLESFSSKIFPLSSHRTDDITSYPRLGKGLPRTGLQHELPFHSQQNFRIVYQQVAEWGCERNWSPLWPFYSQPSVCPPHCLLYPSHFPGMSQSSLLKIKFFFFWVFYSPLFSFQLLAQCFENSKYSSNVCWMKISHEKIP